MRISIKVKDYLGHTLSFLNLSFRLKCVLKKITILNNIGHNKPRPRSQGLRTASSGLAKHRIAGTTKYTHST